MKALNIARNASDADLRRYTKRIALLLVVGTIAFTAFYVIDRWRPPAPSIVDQQLVALEQAVRDNPNDIAVRGQLADTYVSKGRFQEALTQYDLIIAAGTSLEPAHMGRAQALIGLERLDDAAQSYQAVVDIAKDGEMAAVDPTLQSAYYGLGLIAMQQNRPQDAVGWLEAALVIKRSDADAMYLLGTAHIAIGELDKAITELRAATIFVPTGWSEPYVALAEAYTKQGNADLAEWAAVMADVAAGTATDVVGRLEALAGGDAAVDAAIGLGLYYESRGNNTSAIEWYSRALSLDPKNTTASFALSRIGPLPTGESPASSGSTD